MNIVVKKSKMTLDKLATMTQREFLTMDKKIDVIRQHMATKEDLKHFATHEDLKELKHELKQDIQHGTVDILRAVDKVMDRFDTAEKDHAADKLLHDRHEKRIERIEVKLAMR